MLDQFRREVLVRISASRRGSIPQSAPHQTVRLVWSISLAVVLACLGVVFAAWAAGSDALDVVAQVTALIGAVITLVTVLGGYIAPRCRCRRR